jgi:hypothetical protein
MTWAAIKPVAPVTRTWLREDYPGHSPPEGDGTHRGARDIFPRWHHLQCVHSYISWRRDPSYDSGWAKKICRSSNQICVQIQSTRALFCEKRDGL